MEIYELAYFFSFPFFSSNNPHLAATKKNERTQTEELLNFYLICGSVSHSEAVHHGFLSQLLKSFSKALRQHYLEVNVLKHTDPVLLEDRNSYDLNTSSESARRAHLGI